MTSDDRPQLAGEQDQGGNVEARLALDFLADLARALNHDDAFQSGPIVAFLKPGQVIDDSVGSCFDAAVIAIDGLMPADLCLGEPVGFLFRGKKLDILAQRALIAFEREDVVGALIQDFLSNVALTAHSVDGHGGAGQLDTVKKCRNGGDLVRFFVDRLLAKDKPAGRGEGRYQMQSPLTVLSIMAAARGLAVDRNEVRLVRPAFGNPRGKAGGKKLWVDPIHDRTQPVPNQVIPENQMPLATGRSIAQRQAEKPR